MAKEKKKEGNPIVGLGILIVLGFILYSCVSGGSESPEDAAAKRLEERENKRKGFHCLSAWDGSHSEFKNAVKDRMRDPKSFEHVETRVTPVSDAGTHTIIMKYRAKNGFGGMNMGNAIGSYRNSDCKHTILSVE